MKPICWACSAPLQNAPFSPSIKLNDIFPPGALDAVSSTSGDAGRPRCHKCVLSKEGGLRKSGSKHRGVRIWSLPPPVASRRRQLLRGEKKERKKPVRARAKEILDLKHGCFVFTWTRRLLQTDGEWKYLIMRGRFPSYFGFAGGHKAKCGISEIILKRNYALKNSSPVWLAEGRWMG